MGTGTVAGGWWLVVGAAIDRFDAEILIELQTLADLSFVIERRAQPGEV